MTFTSFVALAAVLLHPSPDPNQAVRRDIEAQYAKRAHALEEHRVRGVLDVLAPGFTVHYLDGKIVGRKEWEEGLRAQLAGLDAQAKRAKEAGGEWKNPERVSTVLQKIAVSGDQATVTSVTSTQNAASYPGWVNYRATLEETSDDTWVKTALGWRLLTIDQLRNRTTTDESRARPAAKK